MSSNRYIGIELDTTSMRGARVTPQGGNKFRVHAAEEVNGDFFDAARFADALKSLRQALGVAKGDRVCLSLSGKQTFAAQLDAKKLPDSEMTGMLKLELRKSMPFDANLATFDYNIIGSFGKKKAKSGGEVPIIVGAIANAYLDRQVTAFDKAGLYPFKVDVLPIAIANTFWMAMAGIVSPTETHVILHVGTNACTLVIDGGEGHFFNRTFAFSAADVIRGISGGDPAAIADVKAQTSVLASELTKTVNYYKNTYRCEPAHEITVLGNYASHRLFLELIRGIGYEMRTLTLPASVKCGKLELETGRFDLAIGLAMQLRAK